MLGQKRVITDETESEKVETKDFECQVNIVKKEPRKPLPEIKPMPAGANKNTTASPLVQRFFERMK